MRDVALELYRFGAEYALERGIIIADTKFEFGILGRRAHPHRRGPDAGLVALLAGRRLRGGQSQPSFDKQYVRDYLETLDWDKTAPGPELPPEVVAKTSEKYLEAWRRLTKS